MYYLVANVLSILLASVSNFLANDKWTFRQKSVDDQA
jgi:putative flippase GtrA